MSDEPEFVVERYVTTEDGKMRVERGASELPAPPGSAAADAAKRVVAAVLRELNGRKGFSWWWDDIRDEDQEDIIKCAEAEVARVL